MAYTRFFLHFCSLAASAAMLIILPGSARARTPAGAQDTLSAVSLTVDYEIGSFTSAVSLSVNAAGELVVLDQGADAVVRLASDGTELSRLQGRGWGTAEFDTPTDVSAAFPLAVFVADGKNRRVQQFDKELHYVQTIGAQDDRSAAAAQQTSEDQLLARSFRPVASTESNQGELFVIDADANRIVKFTTRLRAEREFGTYASGDGRLHMPTDLCMTEDGRVAVADGRRIVFFDQFGNYLFTHHFDSTMTVHAVASAGPEIIAVAPRTITVIGASPSSRGAIEHFVPSMIIGTAVEEFRDAARTNDWWFILTPKSVLVCRRTGME